MVRLVRLAPICLRNRRDSTSPWCSKSATSAPTVLHGQAVNSPASRLTVDVTLAAHYKVAARDARPKVIGMVARPQHPTWLSLLIAPDRIAFGVF